MAVFNYDDYTGSADYITWTNPGDQIAANILAISEGTDFNGNKCPELILDVEGDQLTLTAGQAMLKRLLAEHRPQIGDRIRITYTGDEKTERGGTKKIFTLEVKTGVGESKIRTQAVADEAPF